MDSIRVGLRSVSSPEITLINKDGPYAHTLVHV
jgi:hypothetical protein